MQSFLVGETNSDWFLGVGPDQLTPIGWDFISSGKMTPITFKFPVGMFGTALAPTKKVDFSTRFEGVQCFA